MGSKDNYHRKPEGEETKFVEENESEETKFVEENEGEETKFVKENEGEETKFVEENEGEETKFVEENEGEETKFVEENEGEETKFVKENEGEETKFVEENEGDSKQWEKPTRDDTDNEQTESSDSSKVNKLISDSGLVSRRMADAMIEAGKVTIEGEVVTIGARTDDWSKIRVEGKQLPSPSTISQLLMYNKPRGEIVSRSGHDTAFDNLPELSAGRWLNVGRLDVDSEGLLLFSTDGELANNLAHPSSGLEREYLVRCKELLPDEVLIDAVDKGVDIAGEAVKPTKFTLRNSHGTANYWYEITLSQGRNRVVRRLFEALGADVNRLMRVRFGNYVLPRELTPGNWMQVVNDD